MVDADRRPTAQEIEELIDLVRRDPGSPAFVDLGDAYLALGRPRDAVQVGTMGLEASPDRLEGRVMLARAYVALHQWKEAQGELLRVVKVDRSNRQGFALLGEVLLRRQDYERAVPVLQHAQNLDPTSPQILSMLKRARAGQPLDPPPPIPTPVPPRGETENGAPIQRSRGAMPAAPPAPMPPMAPPMGAPMPAAPPHSMPQAPPMSPHQVPTASPQMRTMAIGNPAPDGQAALLQPEAVAPVAPVVPAGPAAPSASPRAPKPTAPPPMSVEGVRPRVISRDKPQNAAAASLRQSAAVGENYLNDLLTGGLLDVAGVRVPEQEFDLRPDRRWGRSTRRAFIFLFVVLVLGIGGGGTWYWWSEKQRSEAVARLQKESKQAIGAGDFDGLEASLKKLSEALEKDNDNLLTFAYVVETAGIEALLYGTDAGRVDQAIKGIGSDIGPDDRGAREVLIGKAAVELSRLGTGDGDASAIAAASKEKLAEVRTSLDTYLAKHPDDRWAMWLKGRALLAAGERKAARAALEAAAAGDDGLAPAIVDHANLLVDDGQLTEALALFDKVTAASKDHPLAVVHRSLARAEASVDVDGAIGELSVKLDKNVGPRVASYRHLALALANAGIEDFPKASEHLRKATAQNPPNEPRFWARVAWAHYMNGNLAETAKARARIAWFGASKAEDDPTVQLVDAGLLLASGLPEKALDLATKLDGVRPRLIRAYALLDLGKAKEAIAEADAVLEQAPENVEAELLRQQARAIGLDGKERLAAADELEKLARRAKSKLGRHALGMALLGMGDTKGAQSQLEQAVADVNETSPNPLAYRTHTALAELLLAADDLEGARAQLEKALAVNSGYFPTLALQAKVALRVGDADRALDLLMPIFNEQAAVTPGLELTLAEALIVSKKSTAKQKEQAKEILGRIKDKVPAAELGRVAALLDPKLAEELGGASSEAAPAPEPAKAPTKAPAKKAPKTTRKRGRR